MNVKMNAKLFLISSLIFLFFASFASSASVTIKPGWNLVHFPDSLGTCTSADFEFQGTQVVFAINSQGNGWERKTLSDSMPDNKGVFLYKATSGECSITINENYSNLNAELSAGWNVLPISQDLLSKGLFEIKGDCEIRHAYYTIPLSTSSQQWFSINLGAEDNPASLASQGIQANTAIIIRTASACTLNSGTPLPPVLPPTQPETRNLTVTVVSAQGNPIQGASVRIERVALETAVGSSTTVSGSTNASGIATLQIPTGWTSISVSVEKAGFQPYNGIAGIAGQGAVSLSTIVLQPSTTTPQASLTVRVLNAFDNSIIANATVSLYALASAEEGGETLIETKHSSSNGLATFSNLVVGRHYFVSVSKEGFSARSSNPIQAIAGTNEVSILLSPSTTLNLECSFQNTVRCASSLNLNGINPNSAKTSVSYQNNKLAMTGTNHLVYDNLVERINDNDTTTVVPIIDKQGSLEMKVTPLNWQASSIVQKILFYAQDTTSSRLSQLSIRIFGILPKNLVSLQNERFYPLASNTGTLHVIAGQSHWRGAPYVVKQYKISNWFGTSSQTFTVKLEWNDSTETLDLYIGGIKQTPPLSVVYGKSFNTATSTFSINPTPEQQKFDFLASNFQEFSIGSHNEQINEASGNNSTTPSWLTSNVLVQDLKISRQAPAQNQTATGQSNQ